jgi:hypothetical protein
MEDGDDKLRRNLVLGCAAILISAYLDIGDADLAGRLVGAEARFDPVRLNVVITAVFLYLFLRFHFSGERSGDREVGKQAFATAVRLRVLAALKRAVTRASSAGFPTLDAGPVPPFTHWNPPLPPGYPADARLKSAHCGGLTDPTGFRGRATVYFSWSPGGTMQSEANVGYEVVGLARWLITARSLVAAYLWSSIGLTLVLPYLIAGVTAAVLARRALLLAFA